MVIPSSEPYEFDQNTQRIDRARVHAWLSTEAYWALGRRREVQDAAIDASRNYGMYRRGTEEQVAYARVITDGVTFAWLCDVFVAESVRGVGVGKSLIAGVAGDLDGLAVKRTVLVTDDAHGLYGRFGFKALSDPGRWLARERSPRTIDGGTG